MSGGEEGPFWEERLILRVVAGSRAQGLASGSSDLDTRGVCIPPRRYLLGLSTFEQHESEGKDHVVFSLVKFVRLALQGNPNVLETLYTDPSDVLHVTPAGQRLVSFRERFLSRRVGERFMGYALDQLRRMERHHRWLVAPPDHEPTPDEFGGRVEAGKHRWPDLDAKRAYKRAHRQWLHYEEWRRDRNPQRAALEAAHGYDTKNASHLVRLLTMGEEVLREGVIRVRRPDAAWLRGIRDGALSYEQVLARAEERVRALPALVAASSLPDEPDHAGAEALVIELQEESLRH